MHSARKSPKRLDILLGSIHSMDHKAHVRQVWGWHPILGANKRVKWQSNRLGPRGILGQSTMIPLGCSGPQHPLVGSKHVLVDRTGLLDETQLEREPFAMVEGCRGGVDLGTKFLHHLVLVNAILVPEAPHPKLGIVLGRLLKHLVN